MLIHTATGQHLCELQAKFSDVGFSSTARDLSESIENLRNHGSTSASWLREVGITTISELERLGPALAYRLVKSKHSQTSFNLLWAMAAGLRNRDWRELSDQEKEQLRREVDHWPAPNQNVTKHLRD